MKIHIEGFGKIKSADIYLGSLTIFVGENNSGKTYLMQLIYQVLDSLNDLEGLSRYLDSEITYIDQPTWTPINTAVNRWLHVNRNNIVKKAFLSAISIKEISVDFDEIEGNYTLETTPNLKEATGAADAFLISYKNKRISHKILTEVNSYNSNRTEDFIATVIGHAMFSNRKFAIPTLFFPASRSGLMLVYREVLASQSRTQSIIDLAVKKEKNGLGLTRPVYDFLEFLQTYRFDSRDTQQKKIVEFISNNLVDGTFDISSNAILYKPLNSDKFFPAHLSSSMVNELAPLVMMLTNLCDYNYVFYDEIETCLHPLKQIEMARLVVRLVNSNYKMVISTHSDTMAIALNNLILLSHLKNKEIVAKKLGYNRDDFFQKDDIHVYQFKCGKQKTTVSEIKMYPNINIGYDFELFNQSSDRLYTDAKTILEDIDE